MDKSSHPLSWAKAAFQDALDQEPQEIVFEKWRGPSDEPFKFYVYPISVEEQGHIIHARARGGMDPLVETLIRRAKDRDRNPIFQPGHRAELKKETNADHLTELCFLINSALPPPDLDIAAAAKR